MTEYITRNRQADGVLSSKVRVWTMRPTRYRCTDGSVCWGFYNFETKEWDWEFSKLYADLLWCWHEYGTVPDDDLMMLKRGRSS